MKKLVIATMAATLVLGIMVFVCGSICERANELLETKDAEIKSLEGWGAYQGRVSDALREEVTELKVEIAEWEACAKRRNAKPNEPNEPILFTDQIQESIKGVVHIMCPQWQGSGFVIGPNLIATARHCVEDVEDFLITTHDGHQLRATKAISDKEHDVAFIWVDDFECVALERGTKEHKVKLHPLSVGPIKDCQLGQSIYVIGSPYGKINFNAVSLGIISGINRDWSELGDFYGWEVAFTTDSAGHPGNSGCPVFSMDGVVRGILVGGFSPVLISVMPCDLFISDLEQIKMMFIQDKYEKEEIPEWDDSSFYRGVRHK
jgi:S1-C subfamily serine protease